MPDEHKEGPRMRLQVSAKADYALRALVVLGAQPAGPSVKTADIAARRGCRSSSSRTSSSTSGARAW